MTLDTSGGRRSRTVFLTLLMPLELFKCNKRIKLNCLFSYLKRLVEHQANLNDKQRNCSHHFEAVSTAGAFTVLTSDGS